MQTGMKSIYQLRIFTTQDNAIVYAVYAPCTRPVRHENYFSSTNCVCMCVYEQATDLKGKL